MERIILTSEEVIDLNTFALEHDHGKFGAIIIEASGGSGIGTNITAICGICSKEKDITEYESW